MIPLSRSWGNQNTISFSTSFLVYFWHMFLFCDMLLNNSFVRTLWLPISSFKKWDMTTMKPNWQSQFSLQKQLAKLDLFSYIKKKKFWLCFSSQINYLVHMPMTVPQFQKQREPSTNWPHFLTSLRMARAWHPGPNSIYHFSVYTGIPSVKIFWDPKLLKKKILRHIWHTTEFTHSRVRIDWFVCTFTGCVPLPQI